MTAPTPPASVKDWGLSWIRTGVPLLWGYVLTFLATRFPDVHALLDNPQVQAAVVGAVTLVWYAIMRKVEHVLPPWLTRFVLGANTAPQYVEGQLIEGTVEDFEDGGRLPPA